MRENEPEQYKAYLEKMRLYLKARRNKKWIKKYKKIKYIEIYIINFKKIIFYTNFSYKILKGLKIK